MILQLLHSTDIRELFPSTGFRLPLRSFFEMRKVLHTKGSTKGTLHQPRRRTSLSRRDEILFLM
jgi:hypothetical protein